LGGISDQVVYFGYLDWVVQKCELYSTIFNTPVKSSKFTYVSTKSIIEQTVQFIQSVTYQNQYMLNKMKNIQNNADIKSSGNYNDLLNKIQQLQSELNNQQHIPDLAQDIGVTVQDD